MSLDCSPMLNYGQEPAIWTYNGDGYHDAITEPSEYAPRLRLTTDMRLGFEGNRAVARTLMKEGQTHFVALSWSEHEPPHTHEEAYKRLVWTAHHWQHWLARGRFPDHPWRIHLERSALTLKGLTFAPTGALVAAATTSLPETRWGRTELGLPLHVDPRLDADAVGHGPARVRLGGRRLLLVHRRRRRGR